MAEGNQSSSRDALFSGHPSWAYESLDARLADIMSPVRLGNTSDLSQVCDEASAEKAPVYLVQREKATPCSLRLRCPSQHEELIDSVLVISEARTMEVYTGAGEYCGTCRGEPHASLHLGSAEDRHPLYKKHLVLEYPSTACEVKLLSLGSRTRVRICRIVLGLRPAGEPPISGPGIDLQCVQSLVDSMGATLSPGAQNLMDMVQFQQKNKLDVLGGFLPLLMGGGPVAPPSNIQTQGGASSPGLPRSPEPRVGGVSQGLTEAAGPDSRPPMGSCPSSDPFFPPDSSVAGHELAGAAASFLNGHFGRNPGLVKPDLLPALQAVCGQVGRLRMEDGVQGRFESPGPQEEHSCCQALERRLEEVEKRLTQHIDQRLEALQQGLEHALLTALHGAQLPRGAKDTVPGGCHCHCKPGLLNGES